MLRIRNYKTDIKMKKTIFILSISFLLTLTFSCEVLQQVSEQIVENETIKPLTEEEVANGLKEALRVSTDTAVKVVSKTNGFFKDKALKILLPPDAKVIVDNKDNVVFKTIGITKMIDDVILRMNRSAEQASLKAAPIFANAIKSMSIQDAFKILNGTDSAATSYFKKTTSQQLFAAFKPEVAKVLDKPLLANVSTTKSWNVLTTNYNKLSPIIGEEKVNSDLVTYVTNKTITGLFMKMVIEEKQIRKDPMARVSDILKRVFSPNK